MPSLLIDRTDGKCTHANDQKPEYVDSMYLLGDERLSVEICSLCGARRLVLNRWLEHERIEVIF